MEKLRRILSTSVSNRKAKLALIALIPMALLVLGLATAMPTLKVVEMRGEDRLNVNTMISSTFRFSPGHIEVKSGDMVTFENLLTDEPHTISIVNPSDLPTTFDQVLFVCGAPPIGVCFLFLVAHFPLGPIPPAPPGSFVPVIDVGAAGLDAPGDSIAVLPGQTYDATVSAAPGTTLHYLCAIHPWMQGEIVVKEG